MGQEYNNTSSRRGKHFNWEEQLILERMIRKKGKDRIRIKQMASILGRFERSIRRELNRGAVRLRNSDLSEYQTYSADIALEKARRELEAKGPGDSATGILASPVEVKNKSSSAASKSVCLAKSIADKLCVNLSRQRPSHHPIVQYFLKLCPFPVIQYTTVL